MLQAEAGDPLKKAMQAERHKLIAMYETQSGLKAKLEEINQAISKQHQACEEAEKAYHQQTNKV